MTTELIHVPFHDEEVLMIEHEGEPYVPVRPICERLGLSWSSQISKLNGSPERFNCVVINTVGGSGDGKNREMTCLPLRKLPAWLFSINANKVRADLKDDVIRYQNECDDVLWRHWSGELHGDMSRLQSQLAASHVHLLAQFPRWGKLVGLLNGGAREYLVYKRSNMTSEQFDLEVREMDRCGLLDPAKFNVGAGETVMQERDRLRTELWVAKIKTEQLEAARHGHP